MTQKDFENKLEKFNNLPEKEKLNKFITKDSISCIPLNSEKMLSITYKNTKFIDSMQFILGSLDEIFG